MYFEAVVEYEGLVRKAQSQKFYRKGEGVWLTLKRAFLTKCGGEGEPSPKARRWGEPGRGGGGRGVSLTHQCKQGGVGGTVNKKKKGFGAKEKVGSKPGAGFRCKPTTVSMGEKQVAVGGAKTSQGEGRGMFEKFVGVRV